jgi:hypothetical protein
VLKSQEQNPNTSTVLGPRCQLSGLSWPYFPGLPYRIRPHKSNNIFYFILNIKLSQLSFLLVYLFIYSFMFGPSLSLVPSTPTSLPCRTCSALFSNFVEDKI